MPGETKRCLYEVLGVSRDASPDEIRSAYRKLALQLHPDKVASAGGPTSHAAATAAFQELVNAYEVLSDPRERSYYDSHRSQILFADASTTSSSKSSFSSFFGVDIFSFFSSSAYSGFSDTGRGFYRVYGDLFASIHDQELKFRSRMGLPSDAVPLAPLMGNLDSPYAQVTAFYGYWMGFCSVMDFAWVDVYDAAAGENRRSRRAMEEENRKLRKKARKEYNDSVRGLAEFVKKRDKRVIDMALKRKEEDERRRAEAQERRKEEERKKAEKARLYEEPEWARIDEDDEEEEVIFKDDAGKKGGEDELLYCVVCSKKFKSEKQWRNHEQSKKHRDKVAELRDALSDEEDVEAINRDVDVEEDVETNKDDEVDGDKDRKVSEDDGDEDDGEVDKHYADELCEEFHDAVRLKEEKDGVAPSGLNDQHEEDAVLEAMVSGHKSRKGDRKDQGHKSRKGDRKDQLDDSFTEVFHSRDESEEDSSMTYDNRKKGRRNRAKRKGGKGNVDESVPKKDLNEATTDQDGREHIEDDAKDMAPSSVHLVDAKQSHTSDRTSAKYPKNKKQQVDERGSSRGKKNKGASRSSNFCETCGQTFDSRNKLFMHLGETGHAMLKSR